MNDGGDPSADQPTREVEKRPSGRRDRARPERVGPYRIEAELGRGGMGIVYRAFDETLQRPVALKALPGELAGDAEQLKRFEREALALAKVSHPHVAVIHGVEVGDDEAPYLVLELVEGRGLDELLHEAPLPLSRAVDLCGQVAAGLEAVHRAGLVHRDLKPANVKVTPDGFAKLLDFGLAKRSAEVEGEFDGLTTEGLVVGTPGYMAPEQLTGSELDARTDAWAWGCLLFECLVGTPAFPGRSSSARASATLRDEPDWSRLPRKVPESLRALLRSCLAKERDQRLSSLAEARRRLEEAVGPLGSCRRRDLPLPIAALVRRAHNAKSSRERHDLAFFAWEASVRLAVAARPPDDLSPLADPTLADWARACPARDDALDDEALVAAHRRLSPDDSEPLTARALLDALPRYRACRVGHAATDAGSVAPGTATDLLQGLEAAWREGLFLPPTARLVHVESVDLADGTARLFELSGDSATLDDPRGTPVDEGVTASHVYLQDGAELHALHPWLSFREHDLREQCFFLDGLEGGARIIDFVSGEVLRGEVLELTLPGLEADAFSLFDREVPAARAAPPPDAPDRIGGYRLLGKLGEGGMGVVYLAVQESLDRRVALKVLRPGLADDEVSLARFRREIHALSLCEHANVVKVLDSGERRGVPYYAMELVEGADLSRVGAALSTERDFDRAVTTATRKLRQERKELFGQLPDVEAGTPGNVARKGARRYRQLAEVFRDAALGLHHLHELGIVHRDVKPENLMVTADDHRVVVMDLGVAAVADASRSLTRGSGSLLGTLRYTSPEQLLVDRLKVDRRADVYSLGATLHELLTGRPMFDGETHERLLQQVLHERADSVRKANPSVPFDLATIVERATRKEASERYATAAALAQDLAAWLEERPITARPPTRVYRTRLWLHRHRRIILSASMVGLATIAVGAVVERALDRRERLESLRNALESARKTTERTQLGADLEALLDEELHGNPRGDVASLAWRAAPGVEISLHRNFGLVTDPPQLHFHARPRVFLNVPWGYVAEIEASWDDGPWTVLGWAYWTNWAPETCTIGPYSAPVHFWMTPEALTPTPHRVELRARILVLHADSLSLPEVPERCTAGLDDLASAWPGLAKARILAEETRRLPPLTFTLAETYPEAFPRSLPADSVPGGISSIVSVTRLRVWRLRVPDGEGSTVTYEHPADHAGRVKLPEGWPGGAVILVGVEFVGEWSERPSVPLALEGFAWVGDAEREPLLTLYCTAKGDHSPSLSLSAAGLVSTGMSRGPPQRRYQFDPRSDVSPFADAGPDRVVDGWLAWTASRSLALKNGYHSFLDDRAAHSIEIEFSSVAGTRQ